MEGTKIGENTVKEVFEDVQQRLEENTESREILVETIKLRTSLLVQVIKNELDAVENPRELVIVLGKEFEKGMIYTLGMFPPQEVDEELDKLLIDLRMDIKKGIEKVRRFLK